MKVEMVRRLFDNGVKPSIFSAEFGKERHGSNPNRRTVYLYPRKKNPGFLYCIWKPGIAKIGTLAIVAGGMIKTESAHRAAVKATKALLSVAELAQ